MRIGILTGGGDVPGLNPCIKAVVYRLTEAGRRATDDEWSNPLFTMYPEIGASHKSRNTGWPHRKVREPGT